MHPSEGHLSPGGLAARLWGLDFKNILPHALSTDRIEARTSSLSRISAFLAEEYPVLVDGGARLTPNAPSACARQRYLERDCDLIEIAHEDRTVGVFVGAPEDWSAYYVRTFAVSRQYQRRALTRRFIHECLLAPLIAHGVERLVADTSPLNAMMGRLLGELQFCVTGTILSERWGPLVRHTKFLEPACEAAFDARYRVAVPRAR